ncbi:MAG: hypothetical protein AAFU79_19645, partial [Myxococcota bacterium]
HSVLAKRVDGVPMETISDDALLSYWVDYYHGQIGNGAFPQFVHNIRWNRHALDWVRRGLEAMSASGVLRAFQEGCSIVEGLGPEGLRTFLESPFPGSAPEREKLRGCMETHYAAVDGGEDLVALNAAWIRSRPDLQVLEMDAMYEELRRQGAAARG